MHSSLQAAPVIAPFGPVEAVTWAFCPRPARGNCQCAYPRVQLTPSIDGLQIATLALLTVLPYLAAIVVPVWRSAAADPDAAMR